LARPCKPAVRRARLRDRQPQPPCASADGDRSRSSPSRPPISKLNGTASRTPNSRRRTTDLFRATPRQSPATAPLVIESQPEHERQAVREQRPLDSTDATNNAATPPPTQSGSYASSLPRADGGGSSYSS
jgi:hypothetical protein